MCQSLIIILH